MSRPDDPTGPGRAETSHAETPYAELSLADLIRVRDSARAIALVADLTQRRAAFPFTAFGNFLSPGDDPDRDDVSEPEWETR